ncbi:2-amino-4-hydroxy-6-hydroxymethyldihydropteridine diphosphokinase [Clostridium sp.]|uniref:2-amino-4-hydroxy-6- hydroxymethyldihydropteridine diphosphokinase n=1 Tax=Clostridium sp. TaxID=1506 RepID=UPI003076A68E
MSRFYISMGSNMGNSLEIFRKAFIRISEIPGLSIVKASSIYNTKPWGKTDQPDFLNAVLLITFDGEGEALMRELLAVEQEFGRRRIIHWGPRTLDLDILYGENTTCHSELLTLPHPWFWDRLEGLFHDSVTDEIASRYLSSLKEKYIDTLVMGCTHYPLLRSTLHRLMGDEVILVNPAYETAVELKTLLRDMDLTRSSEDLERFSEENSRRAAAGEPILDPYQFFVSDRAENFTRFAKAILPNEVKDTKQINIEEY